VGLREMGPAAELAMRRVQVSIYIFMYSYICVYIYICIYIYIYIYICMYVYMYVCMYKYIYILCIYKYISRLTWSAQGAGTSYICM